MATEVNQALAAHAQELLDEAAGRGQRAIDQVEADLEEFARLLDGQVHRARADHVVFRRSASQSDPCRHPIR